MASQRPKLDKSGNNTVQSPAPGGRNSKQTGDNPREPGREAPGDTKKFKGTSTESKHFTHASPKLQVPPDKPTPKSQILPPPSLQGATNKPAAKQQPHLSEILVDFLKIPLGDYKACERYCQDNPDLWYQDIDELRSLSIRYLDEGKDENARRCAERWFIVASARRRELTAAEANAELKSLIKDDSSFQDTLSQVLITFSQNGNDIGQVDSVPVQKGSQSPTSARVATSTTKGPTLGSNVGSPQGTGNVASRRSTGRKSDVSEQPRPHPLAIRKRTDRTASSTQDQSSASASHPDPDAETVETVDDDITLDDDRPASITGRNLESGPRFNLIDDDYEHRDILHASYILRKGREAVEFFVKGRVFAMVWHENAGSFTNPRTTEISDSLDKPFHRHTRNKDGIVIFSHIRRFVIVKAKPKRGYCWAIPINTYGGHGLTQKKMHMEEKQAHAIIHASDKDPGRLKGEVKLNKQPISVDMAEGEELRTSSRLHFGKPQSIEWNVKVKDVGLITKRSHIQRLTFYFNQEVRKGDDTGTEVEAGPSSSTAAPQQG